MAIEKEKARGTQNRSAEFEERNKRKENELLHENLSKCDCFCSVLKFIIIIIIIIIIIEIWFSF